ncbi:MarR family winged helix-turn-helix transcriptional regulator [Leifsonia sp. Leaf264]|uniref:MarR family winged helix-turn-helix transcriptional regulator n=1 Tax=Leifsonia sp. Leaf264 TaxID=1736314 RepID=UPI001F23C72B|nr:MarR family transcriptional regulator [Leifsonia sp. Leaf264]
MTSSEDAEGPRADATAGDTPNVLEALQVYRAAEAAMRRRTGAAMGLGESDILALRFILDAHALGRVTAPKDITEYLGISSASTSVLLTRLERGGFVERRPSAVDRRSIEVVPTAAAEGDTGPMLAVANAQMADATHELTPEEAVVVTSFLARMRETVDRIGHRTKG